MTEEIIKSITDAEEKASEIKRLANEQALQILSKAEEDVARMEKNSSDDCKNYREQQIKQAIECAESDYVTTLKQNGEKSRAVCADHLSKADGVVNKIVGRIISGDC